MIDVVELVKQNKGKFEWSELKSEADGYTLYIQVFKDAMKFDDIPAMTWNFQKIPYDDRKFNGVRLPATAYQLQQIADLLDCMLMTTKVIDMIWLQATNKFNCITAVNQVIVANCNIHDYHLALEKKSIGEGLTSCIGKYWCLTNKLNNYGLIKGHEAACNYGWFSSSGSGPCLTPGTRCWQREGFKHNNRHYDPSQLIRLMNRKARLVCPDGSEKEVDLMELANTDLAKLFHHNSRLTYLRQKGVPQLEPLPKPEPIKQKDLFKELLNKFVSFFSKNRK